MAESSSCNRNHLVLKAPKVCDPWLKTAKFYFLPMLRVLLGQPGSTAYQSFRDPGQGVPTILGVRKGREGSGGSCVNNSMPGSEVTLVISAQNVLAPLNRRSPAWA